MVSSVSKSKAEPTVKELVVFKGLMCFITGEIKCSLVSGPF